MQKKYALFDFDGTLCRGDSIVPFCRYARKQKYATRRQLLAGVSAAIRFKLGRMTIEEAKAAALAWMKGRSLLEMEDLARRFCNDVLVPNFFPCGIAALQKEKAEGAAVLLITASPSFYLEPMKEILGVTDVIGTRLDVDPSGLYTGLVGDNCRGLQKPLRLAEYLASKGERLDYDTSAAYGNSSGDIPMLQVCSRKVAVNPGKKMRKLLAQTENVTVVRWGVKPAPKA
jgi:HAD superfamily hydrolase (TIGR01490 family)